jgi:hypothetical protein
MNATPEIRALVKVVFFLLGTLIACLITVYASSIYGPGTVMIGLGLMLLAVFAKWFYDSAVADERYKDTLREMQSTIRGEQQ